MRAVIVERHGGPETLKLTEAPVPAPGADEALVRVAYAALTPLDMALRSGAMTWGAPPLPYVPGGEFSGVVEAVGPGVDPAWRGRRVVVRSHRQGGMAEFAVAGLGEMSQLPDGIDLALGAVYLSPTLTAWHAIHTVGRVRKGDVVLLHSAAGPVAIMASWIAAAAEARTIGLAGGPAKVAYAKSYGLDEVIDYRAEPDWPVKVKGLTGGRGADLIIDGVQGADALKNLDALAPFGQVLFLGQTGGAGPPVPIGRLIAGSAAVRGMVVGAAAALTGGAEQAEIDTSVASGVWRFPLNPPRPIEEVAEAAAAFEARALCGRTVFALAPNDAKSAMI